jgi:hypothetical protein
LQPCRAISIKNILKEKALKTKLLGIISLLTLLVTVLWLVFMIWGIASAGPLNTFDEVLMYVSRPTALFFLSYLNAALVTLLATAWMAGLYSLCKTVVPQWALVGLLFVPVYCTFNLFSYLSQVTVVPVLIELRQMAQYSDICELLLRLMIQQWSGSAVAVFNNLAYAILGIPSIIFGIGLWRLPRPQRLGGFLLAANGAACILGFAGILLRSPWLSNGSVLGGVLFLLALIPISLALLNDRAG